MGQTAGGRLTRYDADGTAVDVPFDTATEPVRRAARRVLGRRRRHRRGWPWPLERDLRLHRLLHSRHRSEGGATMPLRPYSCANCGHWQRWFAEPPFCPVCTDVRNALPDDGWEWITPADLAGREARWAQVAPGVAATGSSRQVGLGTTGWVIETDGGLVGWEGAGFYPPAALASCAAAAGWSRWARATCTATARCGSCRTSWPRRCSRSASTTCSGPRRSASPGPPTTATSWPPAWSCTAAAAHFPGHSVLHDERRGILFVGDLLKVDLARDADVARPCRPVVPQGVPRADPAVARRDPPGPRAGRAAGVRRRRDTVRVRRAGVEKQVLALFDRQLAGQPTPGPVPLGELA